MERIRTRTLNHLQKQELTQLAKRCQAHEPLALSAPLEDGLEYVLAMDGGQLAGFAFLFFPEETICECSAFVDPGRRRQGVFRQLLDDVLDLVDDREKQTGSQIDFCFLIDERTPSAMAVMKALEAEYWYSEYTMVRPLSQEDADYRCGLQICRQEDGLYAAVLDGAAAGTCAILPGESGYYLYAFQIREDLRGQGYGRDFLLGMLALLAADRSAPRQVSLQVSGLNGAARSLYKKTGFRDAESLSYYLY